MKTKILLLLVMALATLCAYNTRTDSAEDMESIFQEKVIIDEPLKDFNIIDDNVEYLDSNNGRLYTNISDNFDITVYPVTIGYDNNNYLRVVYTYDVTNKTPNTYTDFEATLWIDKRMEQYIQSGVTVFPPMKVTLKPKDQITDEGDLLGITSECGRLLFQSELNKGLGIDYATDIVGKMKLQLNWKDCIEPEVTEFRVGVNNEL